MTVTPASPASASPVPAVETFAASAPAHAAPELLTRRDFLLRWGVVAAVVAGILAWPVPEGITAKAWRLLAIFLGTIVGSIVRPIAAGAMVFLGVAAVALTGTLTPAQALGGYADPIVWLVLAPSSSPARS
jgi:DASS family divalent anion:Na+ symporter